MGRDAADLGQPTADDPHGYFPSEDENQVTGRDRGRAWSEAVTSQGTVEPPEAGRSKRGSPLRADSGPDSSGPADTLILEFWPPDCC